MLLQLCHPCRPNCSAVAGCLLVPHVAACACTPAARPFNEEEASLFEESAQFAYRSFRDKAAASRNMSVHEMQVGGIGLHSWRRKMGGSCHICST